jgi:hypothetical protein
MAIVLDGTNGITTETGSGDVSVGDDLIFTGTGNRITGDFSNATQANRVLFQTSTANGNTLVGYIPNGTGTSTATRYFNSSSADNCAQFDVGLLIAGTEARIASGITGSGTYVPITFSAGGSERVRIDTSGNVGIGTTTPVAQLGLYGTGQTTAAMSTSSGLGGTLYARDSGGAGGNGGAVMFGANQGAFAAIKGLLTDGSNNTLGALAFSNRSASTDATLTERMRIDSSGNLLVGRTSGIGGSKFLVKASTTGTGAWVTVTANTVDGVLFGVLDNGGISTGTFTSSPYNLTTGSAANAFLESDGLLKRSTSSLRYKTDVQDATHGLAEVMALRSVTYKGKNDGDKVFSGLIAEEVDEAGLTEFVVYDSEGRPDALHYGNMVALAFKAIQELKTINDAQAQIITALTARVEALEGAQA